MFNRGKPNLSDVLFEQQLNNYNPKIELIIKLNPKKFLDTRLICVNSICNTMVRDSQPNHQLSGHLKYLNAINATALLKSYPSGKEF